MQENQPTKITISQNNTTMSAELPWDACLDDIMDAFVGCLRGISFGEWVIGGIKEWAEDRMPESDEDTE